MNCQKNKVIKSHGIFYLENRDKLLKVNDTNTNDVIKILEKQSSNPFKINGLFESMRSMTWTLYLTLYPSHNKIMNKINIKKNVVWFTLLLFLLPQFILLFLLLLLLYVYSFYLSILILFTCESGYIKCVCCI